MKFLISAVLLLTSAPVALCSTPAADIPQKAVEAGSRECSDVDTLYSGYVYHWKRGYFRGDKGEYHTVAHYDHEFRDQIADLLRKHDTRSDAVCYRVQFCGRVGGDSGDLVNTNIEIHRGISFKPIDCPSD